MTTIRKCIIFDFDGVIADTFKATEEIGNRILGRYGIAIGAERAKKVGLRRTILETRFPKWKIPQTMAELHREIGTRISREIQPFAGIPEVLKKLSGHYQLGIVSSNSRENITAFLEKHQLSGFFSFVFSESSLFGKHVVLKNLCREYRFEYRDVLYIGDEDRDIQAAKKLHISVIAVTWGYNDRSLLQAESPGYLVDSPLQILDILLKK